MEKKSREKIIYILIFVVVCIILIVDVIVGSIWTSRMSKPLDISVNNNNIVITNWGNDSIALKNIEQIELLNKSPETYGTDNGDSNYNKLYLGIHVKGFGVVKCFVENTNCKNIYIKTKNQSYLLGLNNNSESEKLYDKIEKKINL